MARYDPTRTPRGRTETRRRSPWPQTAGALLWAAVAQYFLMMVVVQAAWPRPYSITKNAISDLGAVNCGVFAGRDVCSPWHALSNASWALAGLCIFSGAILLWRTLVRDVWSGVGLGLLTIAGVGEFVVGFHPEDTSAWHAPAAAVAIIGGLAAITVLGLSLMRTTTHRSTGQLGVALGATGITAVAAWLVFEPRDLFGLVERLAAYPILIWITLTGWSLLRSTRERAAAEPQRSDTAP